MDSHKLHIRKVSLGELLIHLHKAPGRLLSYSILPDRILF